MENMHAKKFLARKVFVTSVVPPSPVKLDGACSSVGQSATPETGNQVSPQSNPSESLPLLSSPVLDPKAGAKSTNVNSLPLKDFDEFEFASPLKKFSQNENDKSFYHMV